MKSTKDEINFYLTQILKVQLSLFFSHTQVSKSSNDEDALINKKLPKELLLKIFSFLDVVSLCRCAQVAKVCVLKLEERIKHKSPTFKKINLHFLSLSLSLVLECVSIRWFKLARNRFI